MAYAEAVASGDLASIEAFDGFLMKGFGRSGSYSTEQKILWVSAMLISKDGQ